MNNQDLTREELLKFFYESSKNVIAQKLMFSSEPIIIRELEKNNFTKGEINSALLYLIDKKYVKSQQFPGLGGGKIYKYRISAEGIDFFESKSKFSKNSHYPGVNVNNINGVIVIGNNNIVNSKFNDLYEELDNLKEEIGRVASFSDQEKINLQSDIDSIKSQLIKNNPSKEFVNILWNNFKVLSTVNGFIELYKKIDHLIVSLLK